MECSFFVAGRALFFTASRVFKKLFLVGLLTAVFDHFPAFAVRAGDKFSCAGVGSWRGLAMVRCSCQNSVATVKLFQQDNKRQFMLKGEFAQGQDMIAPGPQFFRMTV